MLELKALSCGYASLPSPLVHRFETQLEPGEFVCVIGKNGVGKSTLMRTIAALQPAMGGEILIEGSNVFTLGANERARRIAVVTTEKVASPGLLVDDVLAMGRLPYTDWQNRLRALDHEIIQSACELTETSPFLGLPLQSLSDGQRQRVMIARALIQTPQVMILDEVTAFLDLPSRVEIMVMLRNYARNHQCVVLLSSHDLELSMELADKIWLMESGQLHHGLPGELIENGYVSQAFSNRDIRFDQTQRRFVLVR